MKELVLLGNLILVLYVIGGASGTICYVGETPNVVTTRYCAASCYWLKTKDNVVKVGCATRYYMKIWCSTCPSKGTICYCTYNRCNRDKPARLFYDSWPRSATNASKLQDIVQ